MNIKLQEINQKIKVIEDYEKLLNKLAVTIAETLEGTDEFNEMDMNWEKVLTEFYFENDYRTELDQLRNEKDRIIREILQDAKKS